MLGSFFKTKQNKTKHKHYIFYKWKLSKRDQHGAVAALEDRMKKKNNEMKWNRSFVNDEKLLCCWFLGMENVSVKIEPKAIQFSSDTWTQLISSWHTHTHTHSPQLLFHCHSKWELNKFCHWSVSCIRVWLEPERCVRYRGEGSETPFQNDEANEFPTTATLIHRMTTMYISPFQRHSTQHAP